MKKKKKSSVLSTIIMIAAIVGICVSLYHLLPDWFGRQKANQQYQTLMEDYVEVIQGEEEEPEKKKDWWSQDVKIEFEKLKEVNGDIIGWIRFDDTEQVGINYPILYSGDNDKYLRSDIYGEYQIAGCIFLEGLSSPDFSDLYSILYGHNMRDGSMFGDLKKYKEDGFYEGNQYFTIYTEDTAYRYQIFAWFEARSNGSVYKVGYQENEEYQNFINTIVAASDEDTGIHPDKSDQILTLSTCTASGSYSEKFIVQAVCVDKQSTFITE